MAEVRRLRPFYERATHGVPYESCRMTFKRNQAFVDVTTWDKGGLGVGGSPLVARRHLYETRGVNELPVGLTFLCMRHHLDPA